MDAFQLLLFIISIIVFVLFFKQLFSGTFPKRGVDVERNGENERNVSGITQIENHYSMPLSKQSRVNQLASMAKNAIEKEDFVEADKALSSALILEKNNIELLLKHGFVLINLDRLVEAKEVYLDIIKLNPNEDMAYGSLANILRKLGDIESSIKYHKKAIELDDSYAPHYFNYANTLYHIGNKEEALLNYKKALELDSSLTEANRMIEKLS